MHRLPQFWGPDAEDFKPERWLAGGKVDHDAFLPFLAGPRRCIGNRFALAELQVRGAHHNARVSRHCCVDPACSSCALSSAPSDHPGGVAVQVHDEAGPQREGCAQAGNHDAAVPWPADDRAARVIPSSPCPFSFSSSNVCVLTEFMPPISSWLCHTAHATFARPKCFRAMGVSPSHTPQFIIFTHQPAMAQGTDHTARVYMSFPHP